MVDQCELQVGEREFVRAAYYEGDRRIGVGEVPFRSPGEGEVALEVAYCGICGTDMHVYLGHMDARVGTHRIIGHEMSGRIAAVGPGVDRSILGRSAVVRPLVHCGECPACESGFEHVCHKLDFLGLDTDGAFQERWIVPEEVIHTLPDEIPLRRAALIEPLAVACHDVERGRVGQGEFVLVIGGGPIGMLVALTSRASGGRVMVSEVNTYRLELAESLGFSCVNPVESSLVDAVMSATGGKGADVVFEVSGTQAGVNSMTSAIATRGRIVMVAIHASRASVDLFQFFWREIEMLGARVYNRLDYARAIGLIEKNVIDIDPLITHEWDLGDIQLAFDTMAESPTAMKGLIRCCLDG